MFSLFSSAPRYLAVTGCTTDASAATSLRALRFYGDVDEIPPDDDLPYSSHSFQVVTMLHPTSFTHEGGGQISGGTEVSLKEVIRVLGSNGFGLIGADESTWNEMGTMDALVDMEGEGVDVLSVQRLDLAAPPVSDDLESESEIPDGHEEHGYLLAVIRRT